MSFGAFYIIYSTTVSFANVPDLRTWHSPCDQQDNRKYEDSYTVTAVYLQFRVVVFPVDSVEACLFFPLKEAVRDMGKQSQQTVASTRASSLVI